MHASLVLNHSCNLACSYCYAGDKFSFPMPDEVLLPAIDTAISAGPVRISFFGGEPLLSFERLERAVTYAATCGQTNRVTPRFDVTTNGTQFTEQRLDFLIQHGVRIVVSLDGVKDAHDPGRPFANGRPSHAAVVAGLEMALDRRPDIETNSVVDPTNVDHLGDSFEFLLGLGVRVLHVNFNFEADWDAEARSRLDVALDGLKERWEARYRAGELVKLNLFDGKIMTHLKGGYSACDRCGFGLSEFAVAASGNMYPCERLVAADRSRQWRIGHTARGFDRAAIRKLRLKYTQPISGCTTCPIRNRCRHWCGCVRAIHPLPYERDTSFFCHLELGLVARADSAAAALFREQVPSFMGRFYGATVTEEAGRVADAV